MAPPSPIVSASPLGDVLDLRDADGDPGRRGEAEQDRSQADGAQQAEEGAAPADAAEAVALGGRAWPRRCPRRRRREPCATVLAHPSSGSRAGDGFVAGEAVVLHRVSGAGTTCVSPSAARCRGRRGPAWRTGPRSRRSRAAASSAGAATLVAGASRSLTATAPPSVSRCCIVRPAKASEHRGAPPVGFGPSVPGQAPGPRVKSLRKPVHQALAGGRGGACEVGRRVGRALDAGRLERRDLPERAQLVGLVGQRLADPRGRRLMGSASSASRVSCSLSSSRAVFSPMPLAPGSPSEGSPRSAMKSGTWSGRTP